MTVSIKIVDIDSKFFYIECYCNKSKHKIMKTPMLLKLRTKKSIEAVIKKELKAFKSPVWGGYNIEFMCNLD